MSGAARGRTLLLAVLMVLGLPGGAAAAPVSLVGVGTFTEPTYVTAVPQDPSRVYVVERRGTVKVLQGGVARTFADLSGLVRTDGERGLLSIAFPADFAASKRFYAYYSAKASGAITLARFSARDADSADPAGEVLLSIPHGQQANHNGGQLQFGPDGLLYVGTGDGGAGDDPAGNGQNLSSRTPAVLGGVDHSPLLGKVLRLDVSPEQGYTTPPQNAFGPAGTAPEIFAYGLRNPYRFSFDALTGDLVIGDVGQNAREEVDLLPAGAPAGANFGWSRWEGTLAHPSGSTQSRDGVTFGVLEYGHPGHSFGGLEGCSVIGGYVVRDPQLPELFGEYVYADYCAEGARAARLTSTQSIGDARIDVPGLTATHITSFGEDACGRVYVATQDGAVGRLGSGGGCTPRTAPGSPGAVPVAPVAPPPPAASGAPVTSDRRAPVAALRSHRAQRALAFGRLRLALSCDELCDLQVRGQGLIGAMGPSARSRLVFTTHRVRLDANARVLVDLRFGTRTRRTLARALRRGRRVTARVELRASDTARNARTSYVRIRVRR